ncbi:MAG: bifunctional 4-hydroxy-2-oxoglutarate aldolase/2-dehydro-3-deoxy-phosphogluconate aldolase [Rhodospirillales bacterium]|nr:bifunctional 4-hydroxy-2-oxoglutarate aldolase/2-dehydro-3-deoxy-phosphogluconate aldolase [Rhodospirillales bacterium]MBO6786180.1 bifunctional 4-hydroxy-2-oxoglutarate aldolase/2-dehydro-3-deoxy-phosphogluconate aldolase [Rhodospirillales bacterium]
MSDALSTILEKAPVVPVLEIARADDAVPLAEALVAGGLPVIEVTLRTDAALDAVDSIMKHVPGCTVGIGSIRDPQALERAHATGAAFGVSPGMTPDLLDAITALDWPFLPGATTISEVMTLRARGLMVQKLFPAALLGGAAYLKAIKGPVPDVTFCPTGGVTARNAAEFLSLENVIAVGGTWIATSDLVNAGNWAAITERAAEVSGPA